MPRFFQRIRPPAPAATSEEGVPQQNVQPSQTLQQASRRLQRSIGNPWTSFKDRRRRQIERNYVFKETTDGTEEATDGQGKQDTDTALSKSRINLMGTDEQDKQQDAQAPAEKFGEYTLSEAIGSVFVSNAPQVKRLNGGQMGDVFLITSDDGRKLVYKLQDEDPAEALISTTMLKAAGADVADIEMSPPELTLRLHNVLQGQDGGAGLLVAAQSTRRHAMVIQYAPGNDLKHYKGDPSAQIPPKPVELQKILADQNFQLSLGRLLAADTFSGNPDRFITSLHSSDKVGPASTANAGNLFVSPSKQGGLAAVGIDNMFHTLVIPSLMKIMRYNLPFGFPKMDAKERIPGFAAANPAFLKKQAVSIFDYFTEKMKIEADVKEQYKDIFVKNVVESGTAAMSTLLQRGQGWKSVLAENNVKPSKVADFTVRKRYMRLLRGEYKNIRGEIDPDEMLDIAQNQTSYRIWMLVNELGLDDSEQVAALAQNDTAYKRVMREVREGKNPQGAALEVLSGGGPPPSGGIVAGPQGGLPPQNQVVPPPQNQVVPPPQNQVAPPPQPSPQKPHQKGVRDDELSHQFAADWVSLNRRLRLQKSQRREQELLKKQKKDQQ